MNKQVVVFGSFVVDLMARTPHLPAPGETVKGSLFQMGPGGKGFNQAVAAHKSGGQVAVITKLGRDSFADVALGIMAELGMDPSALLYSDAVPTGSALISVDEATSQNQIVVVPGACGAITREDVLSRAELLQSAGFLLTQLETNLDAMELAVDLARQGGAKVILNPAPVQPLTDALLAKIHLVTPNEVEAEHLTGVPVADEESAARAARWFFDRGVAQVVITLGGRGVYVDDGQRRAILPAHRVEVLDTTGAGDAFNGGLVTALSEGADLWEAARFANALASLAVQRLGTTLSMPTRAEIDAFRTTRGC